MVSWYNPTIIKFVDEKNSTILEVQKNSIWFGWNALTNLFAFTLRDLKIKKFYFHLEFSLKSTTFSGEDEHLKNSQAHFLCF